MPRYHVLYNPHAGNGHGTEDTMKLKDIMKDDELVFCNMTTIESYKTFFASLAEDDRVIVAGGDGTLNRFINDTDGLSLCHDVYYYATGSGNDFWHDLGFQKGDPPVCVNDYIKDLPVATVNGKSFTVKVAEGTVAPAAGAAPAASGDAVPLPSPLPGTVVKIAVAEGDEVAEGDVILVIEAMKMETKAPKAGIVREISVTQSQVVAAGDTLAMIEEK